MNSSRKAALIRGLNVGKARRLGMPELRAIIQDLGYRDVRTLLASGNAVFTAPGVKPQTAAARIADALTATLDVATCVTVLTAAELDVIVRENPLVAATSDPSRLFVAFLSQAKERSRLQPLLRQNWTPEALALGSRAGYLWCPAGLMGGRLADAIARALGDAVTTRTWGTVTKLHSLALQ